MGDNLADVGDMVEVNCWKGYQGVVFGINPLNGLAQVQWIDEDCGLTVHWSREHLTVIRRNPLSN